MSVQYEEDYCDAYDDKKYNYQQLDDWYEDGDEKVIQKKEKHLYRIWADKIIGQGMKVYAKHFCEAARKGIVKLNDKSGTIHLLYIRNCKKSIGKLKEWKAYEANLKYIPDDQQTGFMRKYNIEYKPIVKYKPLVKLGNLSGEWCDIE